MSTQINAKQLEIDTHNADLRKHTNTPVSFDVIDNFFNGIEQNPIDKLNGKAISMALKLAYYCGLEIQEIIALKIEDIPCDKSPLENENYNISNELTIPDNIKTKKNSRKVQLSSQIVTYLKSYLSYIKNSTNHNMNTKIPLIYNKKLSHFSRETFDNHVDKYFNLDSYANDNLSFNKIRYAGICRYYGEVIDMEGSSCIRPLEYIINKTAAFARLSEKETKNILTSKMTSAGTPSRSSNYTGNSEVYDELINYLKITDQLDRGDLIKMLDVVVKIDINDKDNFCEFRSEYFKAIDRSKDLENLDRQFVGKGLNNKKLFKRVFIANCRDKKRGIPRNEWRKVKFRTKP